MNKIVLGTLVSCLLLVGCGGGSSGSSKSSSPQVSSSSSSSVSSSSSSSSNEESSSSAHSPAAPSLAATADSRRITLSWSSVDGADNYDLYFATEPGVTPDNYLSLAGGDIRSDVESGYQLTELDNGTTYYLVLVAKSAENGAIPASNEVSAMPVVPPVIVTGLLNDTGIEWCADANTTNLDCPVDNFPGQDGDSGRDAQARAGSLAKVGGGDAGFDFTKLDQNGNDLPASATEWSCVRDNHTGLIWEVKTNDGLRNHRNHYTWYNPDSATNGGDAGRQNGGFCSGSDCDTHAFVQAVNAQGLCGANDWSIPTPHELLGISHYGRANPAIDTDYFPNTRSSFFWTSSPHAVSIFAITVHFSYGRASYFFKSEGNSVRLVRNGR